MDKRSERNDIQSFKLFLNEFCESVNEKEDGLDPVPIRCPNPRLTPDEVEGECLDWVINYLSTRDCPSVLAAHIAREVYLRVSRSDLDQFLNEDVSSDPKTPADEGNENHNGQETQNEQKNNDKLIVYNAEDLQKDVLETTERVCKSWAEHLPELAVSNGYHKVSFNAIKNTRRKMEDAHVIVPDLNALFGLKDEPAMSFYGVFDGHAGTDASLFTSKHIHRNLVQHGCLDKNPAEALRSAFRLTDEQFIPKAKREKWRSGTTGVTALVRDNTAYLSWLGDSQAVVVKDGRCVTHMEPHKPDRQDERDRIESQGGFVMMVGDLWRVGGNIAVSRAIGDVNYKPFISSEAEVTTIKLDGTEDYMVLACDGLWDVVTEEDLPKIVYNFLVEADGDQSNIAKSLVQYAKDNESMDNISVVIVFFREKVAEPKSDSGLFNFLLCESTQGADQSANGKGEKGDKSKETDRNVDKGGNSDNQKESGNSVQDCTDNQSNLKGDSDDITDHVDKDEKFGENSSMVYQGNDSSHLELSSLEVGGEVYVRIGHLLGMESPESTEFVNALNNHEIPEYESSTNLLLDSDDSPLSQDVDLDYYGVFNTRLVDGPIDLSSLDDQNSSILLKDIADSMYNRKYTAGESALPESVNVYQKEQEILDHRTLNKPRPAGPLKGPVKGVQKNKKGFSNSPICWAFAGKNKATVQNHRLNLAAKGTTKGSNLTPGEMKLAAKAPYHLPDRKFAQLSVSKENILNTSSNLTLPKRDILQTNPKPKLKKTEKTADIRPGFTVFGSKANLQNEAQKFHTSWRPRKPLKPLTTAVFEMPPTPFTNKPLSNYQRH